MLDLINLSAGTFGQEIGDSLLKLWQSTGIYSLFNGTADIKNIIMLVISFILVYLAIVKKFEPLLLLPIAFGIFIVNIPGAYKILFGTKGYIVTDKYTNVEVARGTIDELLNIFNPETLSLDGLIKHFDSNNVAILGSSTVYDAGTLVLSSEQVIRDQGLFYYIYKGVDWVIFPPIIFLGIGAMTDFGPLIANPKSMIIGAAAQLGIFLTYF